MCGKAKNAIQVATALQDIINQSLSLEAVLREFKTVIMKACINAKKHLLSKSHRHANLD